MKPTDYTAQGYLEVAGLLLDKGLLAPQQIRARVIKHWHPGSRFYRFNGSYLLIWPTPIAMRAEMAQGAPLIAYGTLYSTTPLNAEQRKQLSSCPEILVQVKHGEFQTIPINHQSRFDPAIWLDSSGYDLKQVKPLGLPPEKPEAPSMLMGKQARALFKDDRFEASNEQQRVIELLQQKPGTKDRGGSISGAVVKAMSSWISGVLRNPDNQQQATGGGHQQEEPAKRSFKDFLAHHIMLSRLGAFLGRRQAKYLNKMMDMFDQGNLDQALRYAIPLSDLRDALNEQTAALGKPSARDSLDINQNRSQSSGTIFLADQMENSLRELYERHFRNLDRLGRHKEAAFILAELLREYDRAVDYLEKHGEKRLAAELAEGQQLHPAKVIKQWMVAGDKRRAIQVARLSNCYAEALSVLEKWDKKAADQLRREFAEIHARAGCFEAAVEIIWPLRQEHEEMVQWARIAVDQGGGAGARMLAKYLSIAPDPENEYLLKAQMLLNNRGRKTAPLRKAFTDVISSSERTATVKVCARMAVRTLIHDVAEGYQTYEKARMNGLVNMIDDPILRHDIRTLEMGAARQEVNDILGRVEPALEYRFPGQGQSPATDVFLMAEGWIMIAKGEAGVDIIKPSGKRVASLSVPCHTIVGSELGNRALLIAQRNSIQVVHKFELDTLTAERWIELSVDCCASNYDGMQWFVAKGASFWVLDVDADGQHAIWSLSDLPGNVVAINRSQKQFSLLLQEPGGALQSWYYLLPNMLLKERIPISQQLIEWYKPLAIRDDGMIAGLALEVEDSETFAIFKDSTKTVPVSLERGESINNILFHQEWLIICCLDEGGNNYIHLFDLCRSIIGRCRMTAKFDAGSRIMPRINDQTLVLFDNNGQIIQIALDDGRILSVLPFSC